MILQRLTSYFDRIAVDPVAARVLPKPGYSLQKISFCVVLQPDGSAPQFQSMMDAGRGKGIARQLLVPGQGKPPGQGINPCFLWDNSSYMLGYKPDDANPQRTAETFEAFKERHLELEQEVNDAAFSAVCVFLRTWSPDQAAARATELEGITGNFGVFRIAGEKFVHDDPEVIAFWAIHDAATVAEDATSTAMCLVTGVTAPIARTHKPLIKGVVGGQSAGGLLVSFNAKAYESFEKEQGENAPVSSLAAFKYTNALNYLLNRKDRRTQLGDATVVFWAERPTPLEDLADDLLGDTNFKDDAPPEDKQRAEQVKAFLKQLRDGHAHSDAFDQDSRVGFYVLGLSPNASRISVRFWVQTNVGEMKQRLARHLQDMHLIGAREDDAPPVIRRIVESTGRAKTSGGKFGGYDADAVPPLLSGALARAVFQGTPYPATLLGALLNRLRADGYVSHVRVAAIKACLVRNNRSDYPNKEALVALDLSRTDPAYVTGRLFALLEKIQSDSADGALNATIKDRYFGAASATPGIVFPRLIRLSTHHLAKMEVGQKVYYERLLGEAISKIDGFAGHLNLEDQGLFAVGYFHQRTDLFTKRKPADDKADTNKNAEGETK